MIQRRQRTGSCALFARTGSMRRVARRMAAAHGKCVTSTTTGKQELTKNMCVKEFEVLKSCFLSAVSVFCNYVIKYFLRSIPFTQTLEAWQIIFFFHLLYK
uniref:Uncharacterized protein n=1 Tax=Cyprinus carpio TaxID=7962 RepID=A0A8C1QPW5_CYPCA